MVLKPFLHLELLVWIVGDLLQNCIISYLVKVIDFCKM